MATLALVRLGNEGINRKGIPEATTWMVKNRAYIPLGTGKLELPSKLEKVFSWPLGISALGATVGRFLDLT